jgi:thioester reductase-like protein
MEQERRATVVTGATGFLGRELLAALLASPDERVVTPLRPSRGESAATRMARLLESMFPDREQREEAWLRVHPVETDLEADAPGLGAALCRAVDGLPTRVIHGAASVAFDLPLAEARRINLDGTRRMLEAAASLASAGLLTRFAYVSTAYVAGLREGTVYEHELDVGQGFTNTYEHTKREAEQLAREWQERLPLTVFRPSIVAGRASTGETSHFRVLYWPLKVLSRGLVLCIPGERDALFDIVPVDFVVDALLHILEREDARGGCYHLTAGSEVRLEEIIRLTAEIFEMRRVPPYVSPQRAYRVLRPLLGLVLVGRLRRVHDLSAVYVPYLSKRLVFDNANTRAALAGSAIRMPDMNAYLKTILAYARRTDFGRRTPAAP